ncbi:hypothetical protein [Shinella sp.]|uniref:hypothetical protein n=1 Tax=Shinella sp. TaxID=1870904 RepID=UPI0029BEA466|nr:hypothetical protein [Shinella sp.]MDX3976349.1 hypothetical protein [Shinella sp.]
MRDAVLHSGSGSRGVGRPDQHEFPADAIVFSLANDDQRADATGADLQRRAQKRHPAAGSSDRSQDRRAPGYASDSAFATTFRRILGHSRVRYRSLHRGGLGSLDQAFTTLAV